MTDISKLDRGQYLARSMWKTTLLWSDLEVFKFVNSGLPEEMRGQIDCVTSMREWLSGFLPKVIDGGGERSFPRSFPDRWIINRLKDSRGRVAPMAPRMLLAEAARRAMQSNRTDGPIISTDDLLAALPVVRRALLDRLIESEPAAEILRDPYGVREPNETLMKIGAVDEAGQPAEAYRLEEMK